VLFAASISVSNCKRNQTFQPMKWLLLLITLIVTVHAVQFQQTISEDVAPFASYTHDLLKQTYDVSLTAQSTSLLMRWLVLTNVEAEKRAKGQFYTTIAASIGPLFTFTSDKIADDITTGNGVKIIAESFSSTPAHITIGLTQQIAVPVWVIVVAVAGCAACCGCCIITLITIVCCCSRRARTYERI
jgi:hypothetical protein